MVFSNCNIWNITIAGATPTISPSLSSVHIRNELSQTIGRRKDQPKLWFCWQRSCHWIHSQHSIFPYCIDSQLWNKKKLYSNHLILFIYLKGIPKDLIHSVETCQPLLLWLFFSLNMHFLHRKEKVCGINREVQKRAKSWIKSSQQKRHC